MSVCDSIRLPEETSATTRRVRMAFRSAFVLKDGPAGWFAVSGSVGMVVVMPPSWNRSSASLSTPTETWLRMGVGSIASTAPGLSASCCHALATVEACQQRSLITFPDV